MKISVHGKAGQRLFGKLVPPTHSIEVDPKNVKESDAKRLAREVRLGSLSVSPVSSEGSDLCAFIMRTAGKAKAEPEPKSKGKASEPKGDDKGKAPEQTPPPPPPPPVK